MTTTSATASQAQTIKALNAPGNPLSANGMGALDQGDFLKLMIAQLQQQDPMEPTDNKEMLAQMAQFSALAGSTRTNETLATISTKMDALIAAQQAATAAATPTATDNA
jgi:flagellar basal-body rod modification protein FlgD